MDLCVRKGGLEQAGKAGVACWCFHGEGRIANQCQPCHLCYIARWHQPATCPGINYYTPFQHTRWCNQCQSQTPLPHDLPSPLLESPPISPSASFMCWANVLRFHLTFVGVPFQKCTNSRSLLFRNLSLPLLLVKTYTTFNIKTQF